MISQTSLKDRVHLWDFMVGDLVPLSWGISCIWMYGLGKNLGLGFRKGMDNLGKFYGFGYEDRICFRN